MLSESTANPMLDANIQIIAQLRQHIKELGGLVNLLLPCGCYNFGHGWTLADCAEAKELWATFQRLHAVADKAEKAYHDHFEQEPQEALKEQDESSHLREKHST